MDLRAGGMRGVGGRIPPKRTLLKEKMRRSNAM